MHPRPVSSHAPPSLSSRLGDEWYLVLVFVFVGTVCVRMFGGPRTTQTRMTTRKSFRCMIAVVTVSPRRQNLMLRRLVLSRRRLTLYEINTNTQPCEHHSSASRVLKSSSKEGPSLSHDVAAHSISVSSLIVSGSRRPTGGRVT